MRNLAVVGVLRHPVWPEVKDCHACMTVDSDNNHVFCSDKTTITAFNIATGDVRFFPQLDMQW